MVNWQQKEKTEKKRELTELFTKVGRIQFIILALIASGVVFFGRYFITEIWAGNEYEHSYIVAVLLIGSASIALIQNIGIEIQRAEFKHQFRSIVYVIMALINLGLSIVLCQKYGAVGSAAGTAISLIVANGIIMNIYYHLRCNIDIIYFWKKILRLALGLIIPFAVGIGINVLWNNTSVVVYLLKILIYTAIYIFSMWIIGMNEYEKNLCKQFLKKLKVKNNDWNKKQTRLLWVRSML